MVANLQFSEGRTCFTLLWMVAGGLLWQSTHTEAIRFELDKRECWVHEVPTDGNLMQVSFVIIKEGNPWGVQNHRRAVYGVDVTIQDPDGQEVHKMKLRNQGIFNLTATRKGPFSFCFENPISMVQTIDFDVHIGHLTRDEPIKNEHLHVLMAQIARVEDALFNVQFEQHWLHSQTARQAQVATGMSRRVIYKAALESLSLIACSVLQVVLLQRLFEKKLHACPRV